jgi:anti-anti-sigma factor
MVRKPYRSLRNRRASGLDLRRNRMPTIAIGWDLEVDRGPGWLFVRPRAVDEDAEDARGLADQIWSVLDQHFVYRVVLELDEVTDLSPTLLAQLVRLQRRIGEHGGMMRICGVSPHNQRILRLRGLSDRLADYQTVEEAVMGSNRPKPR